MYHEPVDCLCRNLSWEVVECGASGSIHLKRGRRKLLFQSDQKPETVTSPQDVSWVVSQAPLTSVESSRLEKEKRSDRHQLQSRSGCMIR